jgi:CrcB protein
MPGDHPEDSGAPGPPTGPGPLSGQGPSVAAVAAGGALGALARYGLAQALPPVPGQFPLATFLTNVAGGLLIGVLVVTLTELTTAHPLVRPFLVTGILGGFTTFSTYAVDVQHLLTRHAVGLALGYLFGTLAAALLATWGGMAATRAVGAALGPAGPSGSSGPSRGGAR